MKHLTLFGLVERLQGDVWHLGQELNAAFRIIHLLAERLKTLEGKEAIGPELDRVLSVCDSKERQNLLEQVNDLAVHKEDTKSVRVIRELFACTWDRAFELINNWPDFTAEEKANAIWARQMRVAFQKAAANHERDSVLSGPAEET
jgi:hypothetical protein